MIIKYNVHASFCEYTQASVDTGRAIRFVACVVAPCSSPPRTCANDDAPKCDEALTARQFVSCETEDCDPDVRQTEVRGDVQSASVVGTQRQARTAPA